MTHSLDLVLPIFTARQRNCRKVIFSQVSLCLSTRESPCDHYPGCTGPHCTGPNPWTSDMGPWTSDMVPTLLVRSGGHHWRPVQTCSLEETLPHPFPTVLKLGGQSMYSWQAGSTHPTEMLSCFPCRCFKGRLLMSFGLLMTYPA